jgi:sortase A
MIGGKEHLSSAGRWLTVTGLVLLTICAGGLIHRVVFSGRALREFDKAQALAERGDAKAQAGLHADEKVDFSMWSRNRVLAYSESLQGRKGSPVAVLRFRKLDLRVPVFEGTDELTLNRGAGWIEGTARPGAAGNIGIAGHRDGFFRGLKDVVKGDAIELATVTRTATYTVDQIEIVDPSDVEVLEPRAAPSLTLVTCYPFYFVGKAPQRFIVHAALSE